MAAFVPGARGRGGLVTAISMIGFLIVYAAAGFPERRVALLCDRRCV